MTELEQFVRDALGHGQTRDDVRAVLREAGWRAEDIDTALARYAEVSFPVPVPRPKPYISARDAFYYLVLFMTLYTSAFGLGTLLFGLIEHWLPDPVTSTYAYYDPMGPLRWALASVIIAFPVYMLISLRLHRGYRAEPESRKSLVRLWLTYLTLFVAACTVIGDLISLVSSLLGGELTVRFLLKASVVGGIAASVFGYYLWDLRYEEKSS